MLKGDLFSCKLAACFESTVSEKNLWVAASDSVCYMNFFREIVLKRLLQTTSIAQCFFESTNDVQYVSTVQF